MSAPRHAHTPVMAAEALEWLGVHPGGRYIDATVGLGGHASAILERSAPDGELLGLDADPQALAAAEKRLAPFSGRGRLAQAWLDGCAAAAAAHGFGESDGLFCDLGVSSLQLDDERRGFSFQHDGPLDMRLGPDADCTAADVVNHYSESELADVIFRLGEERRARRIARAIVERRPLHSTGELAEAVLSAGLGPRRRIHPATHVFRAVRLEVNRELERLTAFLAAARDLLTLGGRLVAIAFHSLEDRIVKQFIREAGAGTAPSFRTLTKRVIRPTEAELQRNPRARSARLRAAEAI